MKKLLAMSLVLMLTVMMGGCQSASSEAEGVKQLSGEELKTIITETPDDYTIVDVRSAEQYGEGHVKGATNIFIDDIKADFTLVDNLKEKKVVLICNTGNKSGQVASLMAKNGFSEVYNAAGVKSFDYGDLIVTE